MTGTERKSSGVSLVGLRSSTHRASSTTESASTVPVPTKPHALRQQLRWHDPDPDPASGRRRLRDRPATRARPQRLLCWAGISANGGGRKRTMTSPVARPTPPPSTLSRRVGFAPDDRLAVVLEQVADAGELFGELVVSCCASSATLGPGIHRKGRPWPCRYSRRIECGSTRCA